MKENKLSRRSFVRMSTASVAALSIPGLLSAGPMSGLPTDQPAGQRFLPDMMPAWQPRTVTPGWDPGDSDSFTRYFFDSLMLETRYLDSDLATTRFRLFDETFDSPIMTAALSHLRGTDEDSGLVVYSKAAKAVNAVNWIGMGPDEELDEVVATGAKTIRIIKPYEDNDEVIKKIKYSAKKKCLAVGMDIDHSFNGRGGYDIVMGEKMKPKTTSDIKKFVKASKLPFIVKGVLSVSDAVKCMEAGVAGIMLSHHGGRVKYSIPPLLALERIADAVGGKMKIFVDCGVVSGMDAYKCLALGADAVGVGRHLIPLLKEGPDKVAARLREMNNELAGVMSATGVRSLDKMDPSVIYRTVL